MDAEPRQRRPSLAGLQLMSAGNASRDGGGSPNLRERRPSMLDGGDGRRESDRMRQRRPSLSYSGEDGRARRPSMAGMQPASLILGRVIAELGRILPWDGSLQAKEAVPSIQLSLNAIGEKALLASASLFAEYDANRDASLSPRELRRLVRGLAREGQSSSNLEAALLRGRADGSAPSMSFLEFATRFSEAQEARERVRPETEDELADEAISLVAAYSSSGAGSLGLLEFKRMMGALDASFGWSHSSSSVLALFRAVDESGTGRLSIAGVTSLLRKLHSGHLLNKRLIPSRRRAHRAS